MKPLLPEFSRLEKYLTRQQYGLIADGLTLCKMLENRGINHISDYSFLVSPFAKAYEGFLKRFFYQIRLINKNDYLSDHFRVGKTLNPTLRYKRFSIFQKLSDLDPQGEELAETLWHAWKQSRNLIFHYFPQNLKRLTLPEAIDRVGLIEKAISQTGKFLEKHRSILQKDPQEN
jgi:hypothetical protein